MDLSDLVVLRSACSQAPSSLTTMASPPCLTLPPEIWRLVLRSFSSSPDDLIFLWTDCRHISQYFKREVEELFLATHLRRILIDFHMTSRYYSIETSSASAFSFRDHDVLTAFNRISPGRTKVIFRAESEHGAKFLSRLDATSGPEGLAPNVWSQSCLQHAKTPNFVFDKIGDMQIEWKEFLSVVFAEARSFHQLYNIIVSIARFPPSRSYCIVLRRTRRTKITREAMQARLVRIDCFGYGTKEGNLFWASISPYGWRENLEPSLENGMFD